MLKRSATSRPTCKFTSATTASRAERMRVVMFSASSLPMRPAPMSPTLSIFEATSPLEPTGSEKLPIPPRKLFRRAHTRQHILLDYDPAMVIRPSQLISDRGEVDVAFAQLAKDTVLERVEIIPLTGAGLLMDGWAAVLEVNVPAPVTELAQACEHVGPTAEFVVPGVETKTNEPGVGQFHQPFDLPRCLNKPGAMMMENSPQSGLLPNSFGNPVHALAEYLPVFWRKAV